MTETELKLLLDPDDLPALRAHALLRERASGEPETRQLVSTYFDTPDFLLRQQGASLRVRMVEGEGWIQTLKGKGSVEAGLHQRDEWETPVRSALPDLGALRRLLKDDEKWTALLKTRNLAKRLVPLFTTQVDRTTWTIRLAGGEDVEVALDSGKIEHEQREQPISEMELELKSGDPAQLFDLALELNSVARMRIGSESKSTRGFAMLMPPTAPSFVKARAIALEKDMTVEQALRQIAQNCVEHIEGNIDGVIHTTDPESVHQLRVGLRRLRSALRLFRDLAPCPEPLQEELRWLADTLGMARDWEVMTTSTMPALAARFPARRELDTLLASGRDIARDKRAAAAEALASGRTTQLLLRFTGWLIGRRWRENATVEQLAGLDAPIKPFAAALLSKRDRKLQRRGKHLAHLNAPERHEVRIAAKRLRYAIEFFQSLFGEKRVKPCLKALSALQDELGKLNDASVAGGLLQQLRTLKPELSTASGFVDGYLVATSEQNAAVLSSLWKDYRKQAPTWK